MMTNVIYGDWYYWFNASHTSNTVNGKPVVVLRNEHDLVLDASVFGQLALYTYHNITLIGGEYHNLDRGIHFYYSTNCKIINTTVFSNNYGIYGTNADRLHIENCMIYGNYFSGIHAEYAPDGVTIVNCDIHHNSGYGISLGQGSHSITTNRIHDQLSESPYQQFSVSESGTGIILWNSSYSTITNNEIYNNSLHGIYLSDCGGVFVYLNKIGWNAGGNARDSNSGNHWDSGDPFEGFGNLWNDFSGTGEYIVNGSARDRWPHIWEFDPPQITHLSDITFDGCVKPYHTWNVSDAQLKSYVVYMNGTEYRYGDIENDSVTIHITHLDYGIYNVTIIVEDWSGNIGLDSLWMTLLESGESNQTSNDLLIILIIAGVGKIGVIIVSALYLWQRHKSMQ